MAILLIERARAKSITAPVIRTEIGGGRADFRPHDHGRANDTALAAARGSLAAPMDITEERTIGPVEPRRREHPEGLPLTMWGFAAIAAVHDLLLPDVRFVSVLALASNLLFLIACCRCCRRR